MQVTDNITLRSDVYYRITHNISSDHSTTSNNASNISVQDDMTYEFRITPGNMFRNGSTAIKCITFCSLCQQINSIQ